MVVKLRAATDIFVASDAIRQCHDTRHRATHDEKDINLICRVGNKLKHSSVLEHLTYTFDIDGISRACLQELARHRIASLTVKSTRYTLGELRRAVDKTFLPNGIVSDDLYQIVEKFCVIPPKLTFDEKFSMKLSLAYSLGYIIVSKLPNDKAKYMLPEAYKTSLTWTINARSLQNFLTLRLNKSALWEIRRLAKEVYLALPQEHKVLFEDIYNEQGGEEI